MGAHIGLQLLADPQLSSAIDLVMCLFPTVHHIGSTPNGRRLFPLMRYLRPATGLVAFALTQLPRPFLVRLGGEEEKRSTRKDKRKIKGSSFFSFEKTPFFLLMFMTKGR